MTISYRPPVEPLPESFKYGCGCCKKDTPTWYECFLAVLRFPLEYFIPLLILPYIILETFGDIIYHNGARSLSSHLWFHRLVTPFVISCKRWNEYGHDHPNDHRYLTGDCAIFRSIAYTIEVITFSIGYAIPASIIGGTMLFLVGLSLYYIYVAVNFISLYKDVFYYILTLNRV